MLRRFFGRALRFDSFLGRLVRLPFRLIPKQTVVPILSGRFRGKKWVVGSADHTYWVGTYEREKRRLFETLVAPGAVVYDVGAHVGYYTLLASVLAGVKGSVYAFEPLPANVRMLERHIKINRLVNVHVIEAAVSDHSGEACFSVATTTVAGRLTDDGNLRVRVVSLDDLVESGKAPMPDLIKVDVEGAELALFKGSSGILAKRHPVLFFDAHTSELKTECTDLLTSLGYEVRVLSKLSVYGIWDLVAEYKR